MSTLRLRTSGLSCWLVAQVEVFDKVSVMVMIQITYLIFKDASVFFLHLLPSGLCHFCFPVKHDVSAMSEIRAPAEKLSPIGVMACFIWDIFRPNEVKYMHQLASQLMANWVTKGRPS